MDIMGFEEDYLLKEIEKCLPYLKGRRDNLCNYTIIGKTPDKVYHVKNMYTGCISSLEDFEYDWPKTTPIICVYDLNYTGEKNSTTKMRNRWVDWLMNKSVLKDVFVFKDLYNTTNNRIVVTRCDISQGLFGLTNNILRIGAENLSQLKNWHSMVKSGVPEELAFTLCSEYDCKDDLLIKDFIGSFTHSVIDYPSYRDCFDLFCGNKSVNETFYSKQYSYVEYRQYKVNYFISNGYKVTDKIFNGLKETKVKTPEKKDLLGRVVTRAIVTDGYKIEDVINSWRKLCKRY